MPLAAVSSRSMVAARPLVPTLIPGVAQSHQSLADAALPSAAPALAVTTGGVGLPLLAGGVAVAAALGKPRRAGRRQAPAVRVTALRATATAETAEGAAPPQPEAAVAKAAVEEPVVQDPVHEAEEPAAEKPDDEPVARRQVAADEQPASGDDTPVVDDPVPQDPAAQEDPPAEESMTAEATADTEQLATSVPETTLEEAAEVNCDGTAEAIPAGDALTPDSHPAGPPVGFSEVFNWLGLAPQPGSPCSKTLHTYFPGALPGTAVFHRMRMVLEEEYGFDPSSVRYAQSLCPDEINFRRNSISQQMVEHWGEAFSMGGISGAPFVGKAGFVHFIARSPVDGNVIVFFGPHTSISPDGQVGKSTEVDNDVSGDSCSACITALQQCLDGEESDPDDVQHSWIRSQLAPHAEKIAAANCPLAALAYQSYDMVQQKLFSVVGDDFGSRNIALVGGIQLNMPDGYEDHFMPMHFQVHRPGQEPQDHMNTFNKWN
mmetsp:Transcript_68358/g.154778  ORF Transcript_68358/g.154778 Transcript_68358/m.154778 type:complete len:489 (-) Transcript_68358:96-1562(-)